MMNEQWSLDEGLRLIRALQPEAKRFGYHISLGGGVLNRGFSYKDLDLYFIPMENEELKQDTGALLKYLTDSWGAPTDIGKVYEAMEPMDLDDGGGVAYKLIGKPKLHAMNKVDYESFIFSSGSTSVNTSYLVKDEQQERSVYKHKLKFIRGEEHERIDVFVMG